VARERERERERSEEKFERYLYVLFFILIQKRCSS
jgi:hypothetical protein